MNLKNHNMHPANYMQQSIFLFLYTPFFSIHPHWDPSYFLPIMLHTDSDVIFTKMKSIFKESVINKSSKNVPSICLLTEKLIVVSKIFQQ